MCQNHNKSIEKKDHKCQYDNNKHFETCKPCEMTKKRRFAASKDKKNNYRMKKNLGHIMNRETSIGKKRKDQMCRKCANHEIIESMKDHKNSCAFLHCQCFECLATEERRYTVKHEAKAKRQKNKNLIKQEMDDSMSSCPTSPNDSGYMSDLSTSSSLPSYTSKLSLSVDMEYFEAYNFKCKKENKFWESSQASTSPAIYNFKCKEENKFWEYNQTSPMHYGFLEPMPFAGYSDFKCKEEKKFWEIDLLSGDKTTDFYTNTSSNTFQEIISFPRKTETSDVFVQNFENCPIDDNLLQTVLHGLLNNEFNIDAIYDLSN